MNKEVLKMKKFVVIFLTFIFLTINQALANNFREFTSDSKIASALSLIEQSGDYEVFSNLRKNAVKIKFYNLSFSNIYASNCYDTSGRRMIYINSIYKNAPVEQIACLIAHESCHTARKATLDEETRATTKEAECWCKFKNNNISYPNTKLTKRLNKLAALHKNSINDGENHIEDKIASSSFYRTQFGLN